MSSKQDDLAKLIKERAEDGKLSCAEGQRLAKELEIPMTEVGKACNKLGIKIVNCQLGCF